MASSGLLRSCYVFVITPRCTSARLPPQAASRLPVCYYPRKQLVRAEARILGMNPVAFYFRSLTTSDWTPAGLPLKMRSKMFVLMA